MGRLGYGARGAIYLMVGLSAGLTTIDPAHRPGGFTQSLTLFRHGWAGGIVLVLLASGMACFAGWRAAAAVYRRDHPGWAHWVLVAGTRRRGGLCRVHGQRAGTGVWCPPRRRG